MIAESMCNKQIAGELGISIKTVEKHRDHLMQKLDLHDTAGLTRYAITSGTIECDVPLTVVQASHGSVSPHGRNASVPHALLLA